MGSIGKGLAESAAGLLGGFLLTALVDSLVRNSSLPGYFVWLFGVFNILLNLATVNSLRRVSLVYTLGWLAGSVFFFDLLDPVGIGVNIGAPALIVIFKCWYWIKNSVDEY